MNKYNFKRTVSLVLCLLMLLSVVGFTNLIPKAKAADKTYTVIAGSDFQNQSCTSTNHTAGTNAVKALLSPIKSYLSATYGTSQADGFLFCGDYYKDNNNQTAATNGLNALKACVKDELGNGINALYVQGNHDVSGVPFDSSGAHDAEGYGVYEMNWDEYNGYSASYSAAQTMANNLRTYFAARKANHPDEPIFIIAHQPLHAGPRTIWGDSYNNCALYAMPIFEAINEAAEDLNIIYLFGHNHSKDFDSYLGGASIFLTEGDTILISNATSSSGRKVSSFTEQTLNFTYMNPGYVGYYDSYSDADDTLTMSLFEINGSAVTITRYDTDGVHVLKAAGDHTDCTTERGTEMNNFVAKYQPDTRVVRGPVTVGYSEPLPDEQTFTDPDTGISVTTRYGTGLTVTPLSSTTAYDTVDDYQLYNIEVEDFEQGKTATVSIPVPDSLAGSRLRVYSVSDNGELTAVDATVADGKATFTTGSFGKYMLAADSMEWVTIPGESTYTYTLDTNGIDSGEKYLIVAPSNAYALVGTGRQAVTINNNTITTDTNAYEWAVGTVDTYNTYTATCSSTSYTLSNPTNYYYKVSDNDYRQIISAKCTRSGGTLSRRYAWTINYDGGTASPTTQSVTLYTKGTGNTIKQGDNYLYINSSALAVSASASPWTFANGTTSGQYRLTNNGRNIRYYNNNFTTSTSNYYVRMYRLTNTVTIPGGYAALSGPAEYSVAVDETPTLTNKVWFKESEDAPAVLVDYDFGSVDTSTAGDKTISVNYLGQDLGTITVHVKAITVTDISIDSMNGEVYLKAKPTAQTGSMLTVTYSDGSVKTIPVTRDMLEGDFDVRTVGEYPDLTVTYMGQSISGYTLTVLGNDYPEYPNEGSVKVDKNGNGIDFTSTGVAKINLSAVGVPMNEGVDVIVMLDTSSSMTRDASNQSTSVTANQRITMLKNSLVEMTNAFQTPNEDGTLPDIRMAIADFNGFTYLTGTSAVDYISQQNYDQNPAMHVYTGNGQLNAGAFVDINSSDFNITAINNALATTQGTNYDEAFDRVYQLGTAILAKNETEGEARDLVVIFMSDGASFQYNYFHSRNTEAAWATWLDGSIDMNSSAVHGTHTYFKNGDANEHRMANAIKGSTDELYEVIRPDNTYGTPTGQDYMYNVPGLGATMYTIGFCITEDGSVPQETIKTNIERLATVEDGERLFYDADNQTALTAAFTGIADKLKQAATGAYFVDNMGADYDLKMSTYNYTVGGVSKTIAPTIVVTEYDAYKRSDIGKTVNGVTVTEAMVGKTYGNGTVKETVNFNANGTEAYSDKLDGNILRNGVICAKNFYYNTKTEPVTVDGITIPAESFHWIIGAITEKVMNLSYYVYLTGSMEGTRPEGSYPTNTYADLHYTNYLEHDCIKHTVSPILPWGSAHVSYAFYLVDDNGKPIVNRTTGETGGFANRVVMTNPTVYGTIYLNSGSSIDNIEVIANSVLPDGYVLYNNSASYRIKVTSDGNGSNWQINDPSNTTYVTDYNGNDYTNQNRSDTSVDYTHTTVWFAMKYTIKAIPDVVVIDYGLSVDINVLANDMFGENGTLVGIGASDPGVAYSDVLNPSFGETLALDHGNASFNAKDGTVRYTPADMKMDEPTTFAYAVRYAKSNEATRYFYSTVTVVPAANMFYEESFAAFAGNWQDVGTKDTKNQSEDRPGTTALSAYDANNLYGYDPTYGAYTDYSYGKAKKITVDSTEGDSVIPTATFTFTGTRFDLISRTSSTDGLIIVQVYNGEEVSGEPIAKWAVDNYFGYTATVSEEYPWVKLTYTYHEADGVWTVKGEPADEPGTDAVRPANPTDGQTYVIYRQNYVWAPNATDDNSIYEIPVIRSTDLGYGTYTVEVTPLYWSFFDHTGAGQYDFIFDAVRVYSPAEDIDSTYYTQDREGWPEYVHVRKNLLNQSDFDDQDKITDGAVFIDGFASIDDENFGQYNEFGPNNEIYLRKDQAVAFTLQCADPDKVDTMQIGLKSLRGQTAKAQITGLKGEKMIEKSVTVATATEMFYDITNIAASGAAESNIIIIRNTSDSILAVTNAKITYKSDPGASETKMKMSRAAAVKAAEYVQNAAIEDAAPCDHSYVVTVSAAPTASACGEATVFCSCCDFRQTVELPALNEGYTEQIVKEPACAKTGLKTYTLTLEPYGDVIISEKIAANGHVFDESAQPVIGEDGYARRACTVCGLTLINEEFEVSTPHESNDLRIRSASLHLDQNINVIYAADVPEGCEDAYMVFTMNGVSQTVTDYYINEQGRYCFEFTNITPQCMGDSITAVLHATADGVELSNTVESYSVKDYCANQLAKTEDAALLTLLSDLLGYGAAAQNYCGYRTDALVTDGLDLTCGSYAPAGGAIEFEGTADETADWTSATLILSNTLAVRLTFVAEDVEDLSVKVTVNGREKTYTAEDFAPVAGRENTWSVDFSGILATEFDDGVIASFFRGETQIGRMVGYSVNTYICSTWNNALLAQLVQALYNYGCSAAAYAAAPAGND